MRRVAPSVIARERLRELLDGAAERNMNIVSELVQVINELVVQELLEAAQADSDRTTHYFRHVRAAGWVWPRAVD